MKLFFIACIGIALLYFLVVGVLFFLQEKIIFPGEALPDDFNFRPLENVSEKKISVDGATLSALHYQNAEPRGLIFFLHGNAGNLDSWVPDIDFYKQERYDLFMIDYRGYGKSSGRIRSQQQLEHDVLAAWESIAPGYQDLPIVTYGRSIGTYFAANLARAVDTDLLVLVSPYSSIKDLAKSAFPWAPLWALRYPLDTTAIIDQVQSPVLIVHGSNDALIPVSHAHHLHEKVPSAELVVVEGAAHNDIHDFEHYNLTIARALP